jgi:hypothetical protein
VTVIVNVHTMVLADSPHVVNAAARQHMVSQHHRTALAIACKHVFDGMVEIRVVYGHPPHIVTRTMAPAHINTYAAHVLAVISVSARTHAWHQRTTVASVRASDIINRAGAGADRADVAALVFIRLIVQYHAINSVVYILHPLLRFILLPRQLMHVRD